ncbi:transcriptional initiation protein Tat [Rhodopseudomonas palustris]|uniref:Transcriptional initiation protein Tat n=1 Tax=Rhodopseudomonas palustris TaxID=1076 RepID=A0A418V1N2_RHOPL|nr:transcriptional initiation protein Tat [Rhodopseudomonas palustris]RJF69802.1 transcriptional initiation protein Tat [Rhodopseudomonas palustris]
MTFHRGHFNRRAALGLFGQAALLAGATGSASAATSSAHDQPGSAGLEMLKKQLAAAPRRRDFNTVPFMVTRKDQWDHEAAELVLAYRSRALQVWEATEISAPWLNLMREALNGQVFAHGNPGFLAVAAVHGSAHLALYDQSAWDKHGLAALSGGAASRNVYVAAKAGTSPSDDLQNITGYYGPDNSKIATLQQRGMVFVACHDSIHAIARNLCHLGRGEACSADEVAADLTNHLIPGAVLVPSVVAFLIELQRVGFTYAKAG